MQPAQNRCTPLTGKLETLYLYLYFYNDTETEIENTWVHIAYLFLHVCAHMQKRVLCEPCSWIETTSRDSSRMLLFSAETAPLKTANLISINVNAVVVQKPEVPIS